MCSAEAQQVRPRHILPLLVIAQFLGTVNWLAGNAIMPALQTDWGLPVSAVASLTNSVQIGFILGCLVFALIALADRISPRLLFVLCAWGSALLSGALVLFADSLDTLLTLRFFSGVLLAGIYPVGMKLAASWFPQGLGRALGYLVGALVLGSAAPHLISGMLGNNWQQVILAAGGASVIAGVLILLGVPDGPALYRGTPLRWHALVLALRHRPWRLAASGYFGHMWELYAVWAFAPIWLQAWSQQQQADLNIGLLSFLILGSGCLGCIAGGNISLRTGSGPVAKTMLILSGLCCLLSPLAFQLPFWLVMLFWFVWGLSVSADSPQLSSLSAQNAPVEVMGSALTLMNCLGFTLSVISVALLSAMIDVMPVHWLSWLLLPGPILGIICLNRLRSLEREHAH
ncbi:MFS transporter [Marinobacterium stanieri]|uniref:Predicted arabinose efflux permease, MFS family n=1 Tax=Marinobacterium stanieri TaxID=49186 RepID=A0A1N6NYK8_9GAMM|nr:MFS transporter [Marinobacterium stanieri]SIP97096.1 Predicted arabinose efflux permease, MFS family [Marinobacterium stanieri]